jgi:hypothetical protein
MSGFVRRSAYRLASGRPIGYWRQLYPRRDDTRRQARIEGLPPMQSTLRPRATSVVAVFILLSASLLGQAIPAQASPALAEPAATSIATTASPVTTPVASAGVKSAVAGATAVYRFWSPVYEGHFYTADPAERDRVIATWPTIWHYEGIAYSAFTTQVSGTVPLYRFWSTRYNGHFYTADPAERDRVLATWPDVWSYEGIAYYVYPASSTQPNTTVVHRFWSTPASHHFYTASDAEKNRVIQTWPYFWDYEGVTFRVPSSGSGDSSPPQASDPPPQARTFPTATTVGLPSGWQPKQTVSGDYWIRNAGAVVEDLRISNGTIYVDAPNVTLRRVEGTNVRVFNYPGARCGTGLLVEDSTFRGSRVDDGQSVIGDGGYTVRNVLIDGAFEGLRAGYSRECGGVTIEKSFIRVVPPQPCGDWHGDGIQGYGGGALTVRSSTIFFVERNGCYGTSAFFYPSGQGNTSVTIDGLIVSGGGYPFRLGTPGSVVGLNIVDGSWGYGPLEVRCSLLSAWQAQTVKLDANGQPTSARTLACR